jgi:lipopolysaccharide/colanic/teichoic acid biosynthesis glycosyltransferase
MLGQTHFVNVNQHEGLTYRRVYPIAKRVLDIALCLALMPLALLLIGVIAAAIVLDSPGPVFFVQERIGRGGRPFRIYKFRTMRHDHDASASREFMKAFVSGRIDEGHSKFFKPVHKTQITSVGRVLRQTSLDELPQLFNVMRGEMSVVGPRPNVPWEVEAYKDWHNERLEALPGITGLAQVRGRSSISFDSIVQYDIEYVRNQSLKMDMQILWWTVTSVLSGRGAG